MQWRIRHHEPVDTGALLVAETERLLSGRYIDVAVGNRQVIPSWAWLSAVAHGDEAWLERAANWIREHDELHPEDECWGRVFEFLAGRVIDTAAAMECSISEIQRDLLVPLELAVMLTPVGPATLCRLVEAIFVDAGHRKESF
jgi:hypothetical protein